MKKKILAFLLQLAIIAICALGVNADVTDTAKAGTNASNLTLSIDEETCIVSVTDGATGAVWTSNPLDPKEDEYTTPATINDIKSQLVVTYYDTEDKKAVIGSYLSSVKRGSYKIKKSADKIRIDYDFSRKNEQFKIPVEYALEGNSVTVTVLVDEIKEYGDVRIGEISLLPYFLHGTVKDNGYFLLPDGSGALVDLSTCNTGLPIYKQRVYGRDPALMFDYEQGNEHSVMLPVFGMNKNGSSVLAVINGNESAASVCTEVAGITSSYSKTYASFIYRVFDTVTIAGSDWRAKEYIAAAENIEKSDFSVKYMFIGDSDYTDMAVAYREYLEKKGTFTALLEKSQSLTGAIKAFGTTEKKASFLGIPYTKTVVATDFKDVSNILEVLNGAKDKNLAVFLQDFDKDSFSGNYADSTKWVGATGGNKAYSSLLSEYGENNRFFRTTDVMYEQCKGLIWLKQRNYAQMVSKSYITRADYSNATYARYDSDWYALNLAQLTKRSNKLFGKFAKLKNPVGLALDNMGSVLLGDYRKTDFVPREETQKGIEKVLKNAVDKKLDIALDGANAYVLGAVDTYYDYPFTSSHLVISSKSVPFAQTVIHGYANLVTAPLNLEQDLETAFLQSMEYGMVPCFAVTAADNTELRRTDYKHLFNTYFDNISENLVSKLGKSSALLNKVYNSKIKSHSSDNGFAVIEYENGVTVAVNYTDKAVIYNKTEVAAKDFAVIGG